jgi:tetratricopeptide (TPR) repeat protein
MDSLFSIRDVARLFGLKESRLRYWAQTGFINPSGKRGGKRAYTFGDLVEVKAAKELLDKRIPLQRVRRNLQALRTSLPGKSSLLNRLRIRSNGETLVVVDGSTAVDPVSGQALLDFEIGDLGREVAEVLDLQPPPRPREGHGPSPVAPQPTADASGERSRSAYEWFLRGVKLDGQAERQAEALAAYNQALALDPGLAAAHTNAGNIYHRRGDRSAALRCYTTACALDPDQAEAHYNLGNIYEDEGDLDLAIAEYRRAIKLSAELADAHFNLASTLEQVGSRNQAIQHWQRYLDLSAEDDMEAAPWRDVARSHLDRLRRQSP